LHQVITDICAYGFLERCIFFTLGHHDHRHCGRQLTYSAICLEPSCTRHLFVEEHEVVRPTPQQLQRIVRICCRFHHVPAVGEQQSVRLEKLRLVIHPQNCLCGLRHSRES